MKIQNTIFFENNWIWSDFLRYLIFKNEQFSCYEQPALSKFAFKESTYGSKKSEKKVTLATWRGKNEKIQLSRAICINSQNYSVLNFLIIPYAFYNYPFFGVDFVSLPKSYLLVLDFQPSLSIAKQFDKRLLDQLKKLSNKYYEKCPIAEKMSDEVESFFSPALIWSKLPKTLESKELIATQLLETFKNYLDLYLKFLDSQRKVSDETYSQVLKGQKIYLEYRKNKDPARPMLNNLFGNEYTELLINNVLFSTK